MTNEDNTVRIIPLRMSRLSLKCSCANEAYETKAAIVVDVCPKCKKEVKVPLLQVHRTSDYVVGSYLRRILRLLSQYDSVVVKFSSNHKEVAEIITRDLKPFGVVKLEEKEIVDVNRRTQQKVIITQIVLERDEKLKYFLQKE